MRITFIAALLSIGLVSIGLVGCKPASEPAKNAAGEHHDKDGHDHAAAGHAETGPHGGQLVELGKEEFHAEVVHDEAAHKVTVFMLGGDAKTSVPIEQSELLLNVVSAGKPTQYKLAGVNQPGDQAGKSSAFEAVNEELCESLDAPDAKARLAITINGKNYLGDLQHHDHK